MSRLKTIGDTSGTLASYKYLGLGQIVEEANPAAKLTYLDSTRPAMSPASTVLAASSIKSGRTTTPRRPCSIITYPPPFRPILP